MGLLVQHADMPQLVLTVCSACNKLCTVLLVDLLSRHLCILKLDLCVVILMAYMTWSSCFCC